MDVRNNEPMHRFELEVDGQLAIAEYEREGDRLVFTHTEVPTSLRGGGIGGRLARGAFEQARSMGVKVEARCPFMAAWLRRHPDFADLRAD